MTASNRSDLRFRLLSFVVACVLLFNGTARVLIAQASTASKLRILLIEEGPINDLRLGTMREPIVEVRDENDRPVAGALVVFTLPDNGPSGVFANGSKTFVTHSNPNGRAVARFRSNKASGDFKVQVDATSQGRQARAVLHQTNVSAPAISAKVLTILAIAGAAAAAGVVAASRGGNGEAGIRADPVQQQRRVSLTAGTPNVGRPD